MSFLDKFKGKTYLTTKHDPAAFIGTLNTNPNVYLHQLRTQNKLVLSSLPLLLSPKLPLTNCLIQIKLKL